MRTAGVLVVALAASGCGPSIPAPAPSAPPAPVEVPAAPEEPEPSAEAPPAAERAPASGPDRPTCNASEDVEAAKRTFQLGIVHYEQGEYSEAAQAFEQSYQLSCRAEVLFNLATALERAGDSARAIAAFELYLEREPDSPRAAEVRQRIDRLRR